MGQRHVRKRTRTSDEIEALLREEAPGEVRAAHGRVGRAVTARLRRDAGLRRRVDGVRVGAMFDDDGGVPRWYLAAAMVALAALAGWRVFGPGDGVGGGVGAPDGIPGPGAVTEGGPAHGLPDPELFEVTPQGLIALALEPQNERLRREARALVGLGHELAERVVGGVPTAILEKREGE